MIDDFYLISVVLVYASVGALCRALFGLFKAYTNTANTSEFTFNWRRVVLEIVVSILLGTFGVVIISEAGGMGLNLGLKALALLGGLFGPDILNFITKKLGITNAFDIRFTDQQVALAEFNPRQIAALEYMKKSKIMTSSIYQQINQTTPITAKRDLTQLTRKNKVRRVGSARATCYKLK